MGNGNVEPGDIADDAARRAMNRLLVVADDAFVIRVVRLALEQAAGFRVVGLVDGRHGIRLKLLDLRPDVVFIHDMRRPEDTLARLRESFEQALRIKTILLTLRTDDAWLEQVFGAGADVVVSNAIDPVALGTLLRETARSNIIHRYHRPTPAEEASPLTTREAEILRLAAAGYTNGRIARELWITEQTVKFHLSNTYRKLGVSNRTEASRYAFRHEHVGAEQLAS
jgi:DNA-binding NarL/FixJ family response regulator